MEGMSLLGEHPPVPSPVDHDIEQALLALADGSYVLSTPAGEVAECGVGAGALLGAGSEELAGRPVADVLASAGDDEQRAAFEQLLRGDARASERRFAATCADGTTRSLRCLVVSVPLALGWEFTSLLSELASRDADGWQLKELRMRHERALQAVEAVCKTGVQPDAGGRLAGILVVIADGDAPPLTREGVNERMAQHREAAREAKEAARRVELGLDGADEDPSDSGGLEDLLERAQMLRARLEEAETQAAEAEAERELLQARLEALEVQRDASAGRPTAEHEQALARLAATEHEREQVRAQLAAVEHARDQALARLAEAEAERDREAGRHAAAESDAATAQDQRLRELATERDAAGVEADAARTAAGEARAAADAARADAESSRSELQELRQSIRVEEASSVTAGAELQALRAEIEAGRVALEAARERARGAQEDAVSARGEQALARGEIAAIRGELDGASGALDAARQELAAARAQTAARVEELTAARSDVAARDDELGRLRAEVESRRAELEVVHDELDVARGASEELRADCELARVQVEELREEADRARAAVEAIRAEFAFEPPQTAAPGAKSLRNPFAPRPKPLAPRAAAPQQRPPAEPAPDLPPCEPGVAAALIGLDGTFQRLDDAFCSLLGCREDELRNARWPSIIDRDNLKAHQEIARALRAGELQSADIETIYMHKRGLLVPVEGTVSMHRGADGQATHYLFRADVRRTSGAAASR